MGRFIRVTVVLSIIVGFFAFCNYAFNKIDNAKYAVASKELIKLKEESAAVQERLIVRIQSDTANMEKAREMMIAMFPNKSEDITNVFNSINSAPVQKDDSRLVNAKEDTK